MNKIIIGFSLICLIITLTGAINANNSVSPRIIKGQEASIGEFPFAVSIRLRGQHTCGGSIIDQYHVITAAHCFNINEESKREVVVGEYWLDNKIDQDVIHTVEKRIVHELYRKDHSKDIRYDIAILKLEKPIEFRATQGTAGAIKEIKLADKNTIINSEDAAIAIGWGFTERYVNLSNILLKIDGNSKACKGEPMKDIICFVAKELGGAACSGDSGSALVRFSKKSGKHELIGILSTSGCIYYNHFISVPFYRHWIDEKLSEDN